MKDHLIVSEMPVRTHFKIYMAAQVHLALIATMETQAQIITAEDVQYGHK